VASGPSEKRKNQEMNSPRSKLLGIARHAGPDPASSLLSSGFRLSPE
jgi:hypothetical protein